MGIVLGCTMHWIIEEDIFGENYLIPMTSTLESLGDTFSIVKFIPFSAGMVRIGNREDYLHELFAGEKGLVYGSINLLKYVKMFTSFFLSEEQVTWKNYRCSQYYPIFQRYLLNAFGAWYPLRYAQENVKSLFNTKYSNVRFARPDESTKGFKGGIYSADTFLEETNQTVPRHDKNTWVFIHEPYTINYEWRIFCVDNQIITGSHYRAHGRKLMSPEAPTKVVDFAQKILNKIDYRPDPVFALDIVEAKKYSDLYLLELSPWACAGLYACNIPKLITAIHNHYKNKSY